MDFLDRDPAQNEENWLPPPMPKRHDVFISDPALNYINFWVKEPEGWRVRSYPQTKRNLRIARALMANFATKTDEEWLSAQYDAATMEY
jgi:hypothetical protein